MRNLLSSQAALVQSLAEGVRIDSLSSGHEDSTAEKMSNENRELTKIENWLVEFLDTLEVLLVERRVDEAMAALDEGEMVVEEANEKQTLSPATFLQLQAAVSGQRQKLADQLAETMCQPSARAAELRSAAQSLKKLGDGPRAHMLMLSSHKQKLQNNMQSLHSASITCRGAYTAALSHVVFGTIAQAASDSLAVFNEEPAYASELVTWAVKQTRAFADLLKRHILVPSAASGCLRVAAECVQICMGYCYLLEARGLSLSPVLLRIYRPYIEQTLSASLKRIEQNSAALAVTDDWFLLYSPVGIRPMGSGTSVSMNASQPKLSSSAHRFNSMVQVIVVSIICSFTTPRINPFHHCQCFFA